MLAYNHTYLDNRAMQKEARSALDTQAITPEEFTGVKVAYPDSLYTPNIFIRIGLFLVTLLACCCFWGLTLLMQLGSGGDSAFRITTLVCSLVTYGCLEFFIRTRHMYGAGVDDALLYFASGYLLFAITFNRYNISPTATSCWVFLIALAGALRYADKLMALAAYGAFLSILFNALASSGPLLRTLLPFILMAVSASAYLLFSRAARLRITRHYHSSLILLRTAALLSFYLASNYFIVREANTYISGETGPIALSWLWWSMTGLLPILYILKGLQKKDIVFLWTGLALVAAAIFTFRYYHHVLPAEIAMIIGGTILVSGAYWLIRYLQSPKKGFTSTAIGKQDLLKKLPVEALIQVETFKHIAQSPTDEGFHFGGGSGGGGGAGGDF